MKSLLFISFLSVQFLTPSFANAETPYDRALAAFVAAAPAEATDAPEHDRFNGSCVVKVDPGQIEIQHVIMEKIEDIVGTYVRVELSRLYTLTTQPSGELGQARNDNSGQVFELATLRKSISPETGETWIFRVLINGEEENPANFLCWWYAAN